MGACVGCSQLVLVLINFIFSLLGLALLVAGCLVRFGSEVIDSHLQSGIQEFNQAVKEAGADQNLDLTGFDVNDIVGDSSIAFIVAGAFFFALGIFGCIGAVCKVRVLLVVYAVVLLVIFAAELVFVILVVAVRDKVDGWISDPLVATLQEKYSGINGTDPFTLSINFVMHQLECCGIENYTEFANANNWGYNSTSRKIPYICCKLDIDKTISSIDKQRQQCASNPMTNNSYIGQGCYEAVTEWLGKEQKLMIGVGSTVAAVQLLLIIFTFVICCSARKEKDDDDENERYPIEEYREPDLKHGSHNMGYDGYQDGAYPGQHQFPEHRDGYPEPYKGRTDQYSGPPEGYRARDRRR